MKKRSYYRKMIEEEKEATTSAGGGLGSRGLDGNEQSNIRLQEHVPVYSKGFTESKVPEPLDIPKSDEEYLKVLKDHFGFDFFYKG